MLSSLQRLFQIVRSYQDDQQNVRFKGQARGKQGRASISLLTLQVEQHVRLVILEHLRNQLDVHVLHVDLLYTGAGPYQITYPAGLKKPPDVPGGSCS